MKMELARRGFRESDSWQGVETLVGAENCGLGADFEAGQGCQANFCSPGAYEVPVWQLDNSMLSKIIARGGKVDGRQHALRKGLQTATY